MNKFASKTQVPVERSMQEVERTLRKYGATAFMRGDDGQRDLVMFECHSRHIKFVVVRPQREDYSSDVAHRQACRQRWRALLLVVKAKLEAVESGIATFETEFLPYTVLPNGLTVDEYVQPQVIRALETREMPPLLPFHGVE